MQRKKRAFIPEVLRPEVRGSGYSIENINERDFIKLELDSINLEEISEMEKRARRILWLFDNVEYLNEAEANVVKLLQFSLINK